MLVCLTTRFQLHRLCGAERDVKMTVNTEYETIWKASVVICFRIRLETLKTTYKKHVMKSVRLSTLELHTSLMDRSI